jgi:hypothetical protein
MMLATRKLLSKIGGSKEREDALSYDFVASASNFAVGGKRSDAKRKKGGVNWRRREGMHVCGRREEMELALASYSALSLVWLLWLWLGLYVVAYLEEPASSSNKDEQCTETHNGPAPPV